MKKNTENMRNRNNNVNMNILNIEKRDSLRESLVATLWFCINMESNLDALNNHIAKEICNGYDSLKEKKTYLTCLKSATLDVLSNLYLGKKIKESELNNLIHGLKHWQDIDINASYIIDIMNDSMSCV
jgi:hypothetical protein